MKRIKFIYDPQAYDPGDVFVAHLSGIHTKEELFRQLNGQLKLPDYFGFNWDALSDCIRDFHWIKQRGILLVHDNFPELDEYNLISYLQVLFEAIQDWKENESHYLEIVFPEESKELVESIYNKSLN